jgi:hypothetical protein
MSSYNEQRALVERNGGSTLVKLLEMFPDQPWNWDQLSCNPSITPSFVMANLGNGMDYLAIHP